MPDGFTVSAYNVVLLSRGKVLYGPTHERQGNLIQNEWYLHTCTVKYTHIRLRYMYSIMPQVISYRRLWDRPGLCREATVPCLFIPLDLGRGVIPFETLQRSRRDPLGP
jgi:hypothetical protein